MLMAIPFPDLSPEIFSIEIFGKSFALRWYALAYIAGILIGWRIAPADDARAAGELPHLGNPRHHPRGAAVFSAW